MPLRKTTKKRPTRALVTATRDATVASALRAGVAKSDITTEARGVRINDPLFAKALVLDDGATKVAIITMDAIAIGGIYDVKDSFLPKLRRRIEKELQIPGANVLVNASHTHPEGRLLCDDAAQVDKTFDAVRRAANKMTPVKVGAGVGHEDRIMMNRRLRLKNGQRWTIRHCYPCPPDEEVVGLGPVDPEIGLLRVDRLDGTPLALVYNFACHPYLGVPGGGITADFPGFASKVIEENLGNGAMAIFLQGAAGDITEILYKDVTRPRDAEPLGTMLGLSALKARDSIETQNATLSAVSESINLPRRRDIPALIKSLRQEQSALLASLRYTSLNFKSFLPLHLRQSVSSEFPLDDSHRYLHARKLRSRELDGIDSQNRRNSAKYLNNIYAMEKLARIEDDIATLQLHHQGAGETLRGEIQGIRIGEFVLVTFPGEALVEIGLNIKAASPFEHTFVAGFSNGYLYYAPPAAEYDKGGYEVMECELAPRWQRIYEKKAGELIGKLR